jgi:hypothetical protein
MRILNSTTISGQALVTGNGSLLRLTGTNHEYIEFYSPSARQAYVGIPGSGITYFQIANDQSNGHIVLTPGSGGNVGIGTSSPGQKLDISGGNIRAISSSVPQIFIGSTTTQGVFLRHDNNLGNDYISSVVDSTELAVFTLGRNGTSGAIDISPNGTSGETRISKGRNNFSTTPYWYFNSGGNLGYWRRDINTSGWSINETGTLSSSSDIRLKSNIKPLSYGLAEVLSLNPISYNFTGNQKTSLGLNAAEVQGLIPEVISNIGEDPDNGDNPLLGISYSELIPVLVNAIKELSAEVELLKSKIPS